MYISGQNAHILMLQLYCFALKNDTINCTVTIASFAPLTYSAFRNLYIQDSILHIFLSIWNDIQIIYNIHILDTVIKMDCD